MSLNHLQAIPVDTHVFQIAKQYYFSKGRVFKKSQSVTQKLYDEIGDKFRDIYGPLAGWAQTVSEFIFSFIFSTKSILNLLLF